MNDKSSHDSEARLIQAALAGDTQAFGDLVTKYQDRLFNSLIHVLGNEYDAQDITQDAFIQAFRRLDSFRGQSAFYTWLFRIARNLAISRLRGRKQTSSLHAADGSMREIEGHDDKPEQSLESAESVAQLQQALAKLPEDQRIILVLREFDGLEYETIAEVLEIPVGTVRSRLHRARGQLKGELIALGMTTK
ncbi:MAG: sigma-70 family RNA polymerase sigma factor [Pirellulaceae bacterium]